MNPMMIYQGVQAVAAFAEKKKLAREQQARYDANRVAAVAARDLKISALNQRAIQESEVIADDKMALAIKALETKESQVVSAGEAGVAGKSVKQQIDLTEARKLRGMSKYNKSIENLLTQVELEGAGLAAEALNRINSLQQGQQPSLVKAAIGFAGQTMASDIKFGDGKMFGVNLMGDKAVKNLTTNGFSQPTTTNLSTVFSLSDMLT
jgi:hypothetical protein